MSPKKAMPELPEEVQNPTSAEPLEEVVDFPELIKAISQNPQSIDDGLSEEKDSEVSPEPLEEGRNPTSEEKVDEKIKFFQNNGIPHCSRCAEQTVTDENGQPFCLGDRSDCPMVQSAQ
jgi:hypothetical protein